MTSRVKFADGPPGSTSWVYITADGDLVVECYDHGEEAEATFGHDVAFLLHLDPLAQQHLADTLANDRSRAGDPQDLPERLALHFGSYFEVRNWLAKHRIAYRHEFDSWA